MEGIVEIKLYNTKTGKSEVIKDKNYINNSVLDYHTKKFLMSLFVGNHLEVGKSYNGFSKSLFNTQILTNTPLNSESHVNIEGDIVGITNTEILQTSINGKVGNFSPSASILNLGNNKEYNYIEIVTVYDETKANGEITDIYMLNGNTQTDNEGNSYAGTLYVKEGVTNFYVNSNFCVGKNYALSINSTATGNTLNVHYYSEGIVGDFIGSINVANLTTASGRISGLAYDRIDDKYYLVVATNGNLYEINPLNLSTSLINSSQRGCTVGIQYRNGVKEFLVGGTQLVGTTTGNSSSVFSRFNAQGQLLKTYNLSLDLSYGVAGTETSATQYVRGGNLTFISDLYFTYNGLLYYIDEVNNWIYRLPVRYPRILCEIPLLNDKNESLESIAYYTLSGGVYPKYGTFTTHLKLTEPITKSNEQILTVKYRINISSPDFTKL